jgi:hypothetical protein
MFIWDDLGCDILTNGEFWAQRQYVLMIFRAWMLSFTVLNPAVHVSQKKDSFIGLFLLFQAFETKTNTM